MVVQTRARSFANKRRKRTSSSSSSSSSRSRSPPATTLPRGCDASNRNAITLEEFRNMSASQLRRLVSIGSEKRKHCYDCQGLYTAWKTAMQRGVPFTDPVNPKHVVTAHEHTKIMRAMRAFVDPHAAPPRPSILQFRVFRVASPVETDLLMVEVINRITQLQELIVVFKYGVTERETGIPGASTQNVIHKLYEVANSGISPLRALVRRASSTPDLYFGGDETGPEHRITQIKQWWRFLTGLEAV